MYTRHPVKNLPNEKRGTGIFNRSPGFRSGPINFDYGMKTFSFGLATDKARARYCAEQINAAH